MDTIREVTDKHRLIPGKFKVAVIGIGYIGKALLERLEIAGYNATGIDIRMNRKNVVLAENAPEVLKETDMVIVLTPSGDDVVPYLRHLKYGAILVDDTHPMIRQGKNYMHIYKVAMELRETIFLPPLSGYRKSWIPGCVLEAIVVCSQRSPGKIKDQNEFDEVARKVGFRAIPANQGIKEVS